MKTKLTLLASAILLTAGWTGFASAAETAAKPQTLSSQVKPYPKNTCIVSNNKLGSMGDPVTITHKGQEVKFCCRPCVKKFNANPDKYLAKLK